MHADANIERLLQHAYQPEEPDPAFVERMGKLLRATAAERAPTPPHVLRLRRRLAWSMAAAASLAFIALGFYAVRPARVAESGEELTGWQLVTRSTRLPDK